MPLGSNEVAQIAHLARLAVSNAELESVAGDLSSILDLVEKLRSVDTKGVTPMAHPLHMTQRLRVDEVIERDQREHFQSIAPCIERGLYLVPKVIE